MYSIIFDVDGTLWDSTDAIAESWNQAVKETLGFDAKIDADLLRGLFGKTTNEIAAAMLPNFPEDKQLEALDKCFEYEDKYLIEHSGKIYDGVTETLSKLAEKYDLYVVSNCQVGYIELALKHMKLTEKIKDHLCFGDNNLPKGENIKLIMERNNVEKAIYVGDIQGDYNACQVAKIPMIYANYGFGEVENPEYTINSIKELPELMERIDKE